MFLACFALLAAHDGTVRTPAPAHINSPYELKALFLLNFAHYVEWPESTFTPATGTLRIGILGRDPFGAFLDQTAAPLKVNGRSIEIVRFPDTSSYSPVHLLYVGAELDWLSLPLRRELQGKPTLVVTDSTRQLDAGSMIGFRLVNDRIVFEVALEPAAAAGLKIGSRMLQSAVHVRRIAAPPKEPAR